MAAHPCSTSNASPLACAPAQALRQWLVKNDLRNYVPSVPLLLCGGKDDPVVSFTNADATNAYFVAQGKAANTLTELNIDGDAAVQASYHAGLVAPFCLRSARDFFKTF